MGVSRRRPLLIAPIVGALVVAVLTMVAYVELTGLKTRDVPIAPADASPEHVVRSHLDALDAHDCGAAASLMTRRARSGSWCGDVAGVTDIQVTGRHPKRQHDPPPGSRQTVTIDVTFGLSWRPFHSDDSLGEGPTEWGYSLVRSSPHDPWRISDQGTG